MRLLFAALFLLLAGLPLPAQRSCCWTPDSAAEVSTLRDSVAKVIRRFEKQIVQFEKEDSAAMPPAGKILFVGSSSIRGWKTLPEDMPGLPVIRRGFGGSTLPEVIYYAPRIIYKYQPKVIVLYCGENDMTLDYSRPEDVLQSFRELDSLRRVYLPGTHLFYLSIKPCPRSWFYWPKIQLANRQVQEYIGQHGPELHYIDITGTLLQANGDPVPGYFLKDGIHLSTDAYKAWAAVIRPVIQQFWNSLDSGKPPGN